MNHQQHHSNHHKQMVEDFRKRFYVSLILSLPVLVFSPMIQNFLGYSLEFFFQDYLLFALSSIIFIYGGQPFLKGFYSEIKKREPGMMTLIAIAISVAYIYSGAVVFGLKGKMFFWELVTLIDIMLAGHWIEMKSVMGASGSLELLVSLIPDTAHKITGDEIIDISLDQIKKDDILLVKPGEKIPADGIVIEGESAINQSMLTGESIPVTKMKGDEVIGGSINGNGSLKIKVVNAGDDSYLKKVIHLVEEAQKTKSKTQHLANKAAKWLTLVAIGTGIITFISWIIAGYDISFAIERMVSVMVISCPHALGLAIPLVVAISTSVSAQHGLLIRNRTAFENARKISAIVFDKTGTLTKGEFEVSRYHSFLSEYSDKDILKIAASLEANSEHPIAQGIIQKAKELSIARFDISQFESMTGKGIKAVWNDHKIMIVSPGYLKEKNITIPATDKESSMETIVYLLIDEKLAGLIALSDSLRSESKSAIEQFKKDGIKVYMATGDNKKVAMAVADILKLDGFYAEVLPHEKVEIIKNLQSRGEFVAMTGDGVNDAPALAQADIGIAVGSGTDIAAETADIILVKSNPMDILHLIRFGKATYKKMIQNLVWATGYNALTIPLAAGILFPFGILMSPAAGAILMSLSTVIVAINARLLKYSIKN